METQVLTVEQIARVVVEQRRRIAVEREQLRDFLERHRLKLTKAETVNAQSTRGMSVQMAVKELEEARQSDTGDSIRAA